MNRKIVIYGHGKKHEDTFKNSKEFTDYIRAGVFDDCDGRYRYSQKKQADVIVLSLNGIAYGHFKTDGEVHTPTRQDLREWKDTRGVYLVEEATVYPTPVSLADLEIRGIQFGKPITGKKFAALLRRAGV